MERPSAHAHGLRDYLTILRRRKWVFIIGLVVVPAAAVLFSLTQKNVYQAAAQVLLNRSNLSGQLAGLGPDPTQYQQPQRITGTQAQLARVPLVAQRTLDALHLKDRKAFDLLKNSRVSSGADSDILTFKVTDHVKPLAMRLATEYAHQYTVYRRELDTLALKNALAGVNKKVTDLVKHGDRTSATYASLVDKQQQLLTAESLQTQNAVLVK